MTVRVSKKIIKSQIKGNYMDLIHIYSDLLNTTESKEYLHFIALIYMYKLHDFDSAYNYFKQYRQYNKENIFVNWQLNKLAGYKWNWDFQEKLVKETIKLELEFKNKLKDFSIFIDCSKIKKILPCLFSLRYQTNSNFEVFVYLQKNSDKRYFYENIFNHDRRFNFINTENEIQTNSKYILILENQVYNLNFLNYILYKEINDNTILKNRYNHSIFMINNQVSIRYQEIRDVQNKRFRETPINENCTCLNNFWNLYLKHLFYKNISYFIPFLPMQLEAIND